MLGSWCYFLTISLRPSNKYETLELLLYYMVCDDVLNKYCQLEKKKKKCNRYMCSEDKDTVLEGNLLTYGWGVFIPIKSQKDFRNNG